MKPATPTRWYVRRPKRSPSLPPGMREAASAGGQESVTHGRSAVDARSERPISGFAIAMTEASGWTMKTPKETASRVGHGWARLPPAGGAGGVAAGWGS